jgi:hypothetical protein
MDLNVYSKEWTVFLLTFRTNGKPVFVRISENYQEAKSIPEGSVITVKHLGANVYGTLQYPKFYRERQDLTWKELNSNV